MKKISLAFLISVMTVPAMADNWIKFKADAIEETINNRIDAAHREATANEYEKQMDQTTGKISVMGIYKVCLAGGMDINTTDGHSLCRNFINEIAEKSGFGSGSATQSNCAAKLNGVWTLSADGKTYQCVGRDGYKLVYLKSCDGAGGECIKQFAGLQTQGPVGREFIMAWATQRNLPLTCYGEYQTRRSVTSPLGQDYIMCSAGGKSYEFEFDSLNQDPGTKSVASENKAMCELFGGKLVDTGDSVIDATWQSCDVARDVCDDKIHSLALHIGHTNMYQGYCRLGRSAQSIGTVELKQIDGVDSRVFYNSGQMRADQAKVQLEQYLRTKFPNENYIMCDTDIKKFNAGLGLNIDYILTCTVGTRTVDFLFNDLTEGTKYKADAGAAAMACAISGGRYAGKHCRGLTADECKLADVKIPGGTRWDDGAGACVLKDAARAQHIDDAITIATGVVITVGTLGAAGVVGVVAISAEVAASVAIDLAFNGLRRLEETNPHHAALEFMKDAANCNTSKCAFTIVENHFARIEEIANDLNDEELDVVASRMDEIIALLSDDEIDFALKMSRGDGNGTTVASLGLLGLSFIISPTQAVKRFASKAPRFAKQMSRLAARADGIARDIDNVVSRFGKQAIFRSGAENSLGHDYYRIMINDNDNYRGIISALQDKGYYVSSGTTHGKRFLAVSKENVFRGWDTENWILTANDGVLSLKNRASSNFDTYLADFKSRGNNVALPKDRLTNAEWKELEKTLEHEGVGFIETRNERGHQVMVFRKLNDANSPQNVKSDIFSKVYDNMPDDVLRQKLDYVYANSSTQENAVRALKDVGAFDENRAAMLADDIANSIIKKLSDRTDLIRKTHNWRNLNDNERKAVVSELHEVVTTLRRDHAGNTILKFDTENKNWLGYHKRPYKNAPREFMYNLEQEDIEGLFNTIVHENIHAYQSLGKASIPKQFYDWAKKYYTNKGELYWDAITEIEARYIGERASKRVSGALGLY